MGLGLTIISLKTHKRHKIYKKKIRFSKLLVNAN